jgi:hypothetical protein
VGETLQKVEAKANKSKENYGCGERGGKMTVKKTFTSPDLPLADLLNDIKDGKIQVPEFQRGWIWDDDHIRSLLASISMSYPIGALMLLETGNENVKFKPRVVEGVSEPKFKRPDYLILDGQQRLTSLFQALKAEQAAATRDTRGVEIKRWYYIDMAKVLENGFDRDDAIFSIPEDRKLRNFRGEVINDYSTPDLEYKACAFPFAHILHSSDWRTGFQEYFDYDKEKVKLFTAFEQEVVKRFEQYQVPVIQLTKETPKQAVCQVFEKVNTGGVPLTVFELITATFAADDFSLRDDWEEKKQILKSKKVLEKLGTTEFLQAISLLTTRQRRIESLAEGKKPELLPAISCKRKDLLDITLEDYKTWANKVAKGFEHAARFLYTQKIFSHRDMPYSTQITPLAAILAVLEDEADKDGVREKIARWFWCGILGELYGSAVESRFARDLPEVLDWLEGKDEPTTIQQAIFSSARLKTLRSRTSAAYKGLHALLLREGALDFRTGYSIDEQIYFDESIDIHHIFPKKWCIARKIKPRVFNSILNKTPLSAKTNRIVGGNAPSTYLPKIENQCEIKPSKMDEILKTHIVSVIDIRTDDFEKFMESREEKFIVLIENAMGKPVVKDMPVIDTMEEDDSEDTEE